MKYLLIFSVLVSGCDFLNYKPETVTTFPLFIPPEPPVEPEPDPEPEPEPEPEPGALVPPTGLTASVDGNAVTVRWTPSPLPAIHYNLYIDSRSPYPASRPDHQKYRNLGEGSHTAYVTSLDSEGHESAPSQTVAFVVGEVSDPTPPPVEDPDPVPTLFPVKLVWDPPTLNDDGTPIEDLSSYRIYKDGVKAGTSQIPEAEFNVEAGTYMFRVSAVNSRSNESLLSEPLQTTVN